MKLTQIAAFVALSSAAAISQAAPIWQDFSITGLYGENYAHPVNMDDNNQQTTATVEYTAKLKYGDFLALLTVLTMTLKTAHISSFLLV